MLCRRHSICIRNICLMYNYRVYNNLFWIFLIQMEYCLQSMCNHMVQRAASVISPFHLILLGWYKINDSNIYLFNFISSFVYMTAKTWSILITSPSNLPHRSCSENMEYIDHFTVEPTPQELQLRYGVYWSLHRRTYPTGAAAKIWSILITLPSNLPHRSCSKDMEYKL